MTDLRDCVNCGGALKPVFDDYPNEQYDNALEVTISGRLPHVVRQHRR